jgi:hypothetical protein
VTFDGPVPEGGNALNLRSEVGRLQTILLFLLILAQRTDESEASQGLLFAMQDARMVLYTSHIFGWHFQIEFTANVAAWEVLLCINLARLLGTFLLLLLFVFFFFKVWLRQVQDGFVMGQHCKFKRVPDSGHRRMGL